MKRCEAEGAPCWSRRWHPAAARRHGSSRAHPAWAPPPCSCTHNHIDARKLMRAKTEGRERGRMDGISSGPHEVMSSCRRVVGGGDLRGNLALQRPADGRRGTDKLRGQALQATNGQAEVRPLYLYGRTHSCILYYNLSACFPAAGHMTQLRGHGGVPVACRSR
jgi:hypothetical protein